MAPSTRTGKPRQMVKKNNLSIKHIGITSFGRSRISNNKKKYFVNKAYGLLFTVFIVVQIEKANKMILKNKLTGLL
ncbi:hypothetical protein EG344_01785 [Chryseobacterium sp. G0162]|nr:hypothetical protein EG344_01785 [Chryseobacterium sp. G0162]